jgi:hypothetical protein
MIFRFVFVIVANECYHLWRKNMKLCLQKAMKARRVVKCRGFRIF